MDEHEDESSGSQIIETRTSDTVLAGCVQLSQTEQLWNQFLKNLTKRPATDTNTRKYPNPDVPEFYPRSAKIVCEMSSSSSSSSHETGDSSANETSARSTRSCVAATVDANPINSKSEIFFARMSERCLGVQPTFILQAPETLRGITHYYWSYHDPNLLALDRPLKGQTRMIKILETGGAAPSCVAEATTQPAEENEASSSSSSSSTNSLHELRTQLQTKNQQLVHMNNVVKALLEEIYKINELLMRNRIREQEGVDIHAFTEQYLLKMVSEFGYPCVDCCARLKEFVSHLSRQLERKIVKQHGQYRSSFVDCILSVIENSLRTLTHCSHFDGDDDDVVVAAAAAATEGRCDKQDACTQTSTNSYSLRCGDDPAAFAAEYASSARFDSRRNKQQVTRVYRNRNYYKYDVENATTSTAHSKWRRAASRDTGMWWPSAAVSSSSSSSSYPLRRRPSTSTRIVPSSSDVERSKNPIQLVHQRFKNLNCRLEGIPEKKLVKFSYIVDNKEYSAIATTKKEAQYLCAWHMLNSCGE